ncbi:uncharacterized protein LOC105793433 [Gossypium raimondii]|uniref:Uncharacterized protein n=1 Tax=Gossypium raimondii TaxID=29730 RepID=A0A0D2N8Y8_GOSRA|nr:uncharacterized protein LOC105793433 [Gossypium raimondii]KJB09213.1 hypothetical protein B456_001G129600 [Gossypium raimondii]KJB09214.1 hypothetical protein B456_001G129600 [Gossypium raimondii]
MHLPDTQENSSFQNEKSKPLSSILCFQKTSPSPNSNRGPLSSPLLCPEHEIQDSTTQRTKKRLLYDPWPWKLRFPPVGSIPPPPIQILHAKVISPIKVNLKERFMREFPLIIISRSDTVLLSCTRRF